jgi:(p)ppGpp synthase/HD superfamily hydrolase
MADYAQTNLELYRQLLASDTAPEELARVAAAYELAARLFTGRFRGSGKTFLAHLVGTAGILASLGADGSVVAAGLLHAAYRQGEFGDGRPGIGAAKRALLARTVGSRAEALVARFSELPWDERAIPALLARAGSLAGPEREVVTIRLANELEDFLDLGALYGADAERDRKWAADVGPACAELARRLGLAPLADALERSFAETAATALPPALRRREGVSYLLAPASHRPRTGVAARQQLARLRRAAARLRWRLAAYLKSRRFTRGSTTPSARSK